MSLKHLRQIGWAGILLACTALFIALTIRVVAVKSDVKLVEDRIVALEERQLVLETEVETRANQAQLAAWNTVDFGYEPPAAGQFLEGEQQLAELGLPRAAGAPEPIRVARADSARDVPQFSLGDDAGREPKSAFLEELRREHSSGSMKIPLGQGQAAMRAQTLVP